jgi:hypothetical protein
MANVERAMQRLIAGEPFHERSVNGMAEDDPARVFPALDLGPYELAPSTERVSRYQVTDRASGRSFEVLFVNAGNVIWGWDVR